MNTLVGAVREPTVEGKMEPPIEHGVKMISMGYFLPKGDAVIWRGPRLHKTLQQFLGDGPLRTFAFQTENCRPEVLPACEAIFPGEHTLGVSHR
ncbi:MAG TPA: P-loop NTPase [Terriglobia bacterium]|nr:P-loop NTPase [Terriglobia bacterium]